MKKKSQQGIALLGLILAGALLITGAEMAILFNAKKRLQNLEKTQPPKPSPSQEQVSRPNEAKKEAGENGEEFVGKIKEIIAKGVPMKCTYTQEGFTGVSYIKGKKMYSQVNVEDGVSTYTIIKDNCMWSWGWAKNQGTKMCFGEDIWDVSEAAPAEADYHCVPDVFADSQFTPPANVNFMATGEAMPPSDEDLLKILPPKERSELESAIRQAQDVLKNIEVFNFTPPSIEDITKSLDQINKQTQEQIQKNIEKQQQEFQPIDPKKIEEYFNQNPPAVPQEGKEFSPAEKEYYYRKHILKDPACQY
ncbi:hypothetical protein ISS86_03075 [Candidatus Microgenomates bacterium]|nr:hypothetical protein [Candidatus Microgenomates bacterium]